MFLIPRYATIPALGVIPGRSVSIVWVDLRVCSRASFPSRSIYCRATKATSALLSVCVLTLRIALLPRTFSSLRICSRLAAEFERLALPSAGIMLALSPDLGHSTIFRDLNGGKPPPHIDGKAVSK